MSLTIAWNRPPRAPHSFSTVSMFAKSTIHRNLQKRAPAARYQHQAGKEKKYIQKCISTKSRPGSPVSPSNRESDSNGGMQREQEEEEEEEKEEEEEGWRKKEKMPKEKARAAVSSWRREDGF